MVSTIVSSSAVYSLPRIAGAAGINLRTLRPLVSRYALIEAPTYPTAHARGSYADALCVLIVARLRARNVPAAHAVRAVQQHIAPLLLDLACHRPAQVASALAGYVLVVEVDDTGETAARLSRTGANVSASDGTTLIIDIGDAAALVAVRLTPMPSSTVRLARGALRQARGAGGARLEDAACQPTHSPSPARNWHHNSNMECA